MALRGWGGEIPLLLLLLLLLLSLYVWSASESLCNGKLCSPYSVCQVVAWQDLRECTST